MSSLSMKKVRGRALNANAQNTNNFSMWMEPLSHKDYPLTHINNPTNNAVVTSNGVRNVAVAQPGLLYNQARLDISGSVNPTRWTTGQIINSVFLAGDDPLLNQRDASTNLSAISSGSIARYVYTPKFNNSKIMVEYSAYYVITGNAPLNSGEDTFTASIKITKIGEVEPVNEFIIGRRIQHFPDSGFPGSGTRSSPMLPIMGVYTNISLENIEFTIDFSSTNNDKVKFYRTYSDACMKVTEIAL